MATIDVHKHKPRGRTIIGEDGKRYQKCSKCPKLIPIAQSSRRNGHSRPRPQNTDGQRL